jgi:predicted Zn-dependent protease
VVNLTVDKERSLEIIDRVLRLSPGDQTEVIVRGQDSYLTRIAENRIHQNVAERNAGVTVKVILGKKIGTAATNSLSDEAIRQVVDKATTIARLQKDNPDFVSLPQPQPVTEFDGCVPATAAATPLERAEQAGALIGVAKQYGQRAAGAIATAVRTTAIGNSLGVRVYHQSSSSSLSTVFMSDTSAGYAAQRSRDFAAIDALAAGETAARKCRDSIVSEAVPAGEYEVILEPAAVADLLMYLVQFGFSGQAMQEGRSFMTGKLGTPVVGSNITIWDDGLDPKGLPTPFDAEGCPKRKLMLIEDGVARNVCYDTYSGNKYGVPSTGHGIGETGFGGLPTNIFLKPGDASMADMIGATKRGILVTRFHYTNGIHPIKTLITGMTRDGTFLIEDGRITKAVKNLRFTESVVGALSNVDLVGRDVQLVGSYFGGLVAPALKIARFTFTGTTEQ